MVRGPVGPRPTGEDLESLQVTNRLPRFTIYSEDDFTEVVADVVEGTMLVSAPPLTAGGHGPLTWTIEGADARHFTIDAKTGVFAFAAPDHEPPVDLDGDNEYRAVVFATDPNSDRGARGMDRANRDRGQLATPWRRALVSQRVDTRSPTAAAMQPKPAPAAIAAAR